MPKLNQRTDNVYYIWFIFSSSYHFPCIHVYVAVAILQIGFDIAREKKRKNQINFIEH